MKASRIALLFIAILFVVGTGTVMASQTPPVPETLSDNTIVFMVPAHGNDSPPECITENDGSTSFQVEYPNPNPNGSTWSEDVIVAKAANGKVIWAICIKSGSGTFNDGTSSHSGLITADGLYGDGSCYTVSGLGTATVTVSKTSGATLPDGKPCKDLSHLDVFTKEHTKNICPDQGANEIHKILGKGMGNRNTGWTRRALYIPNSADVTAIYAMFAGQKIGDYPKVSFSTSSQQVDLITPTSPAYRKYAVYNYGTELDPADKVKVTVFETAPPGQKTPRALVAIPTYKTELPYSSVFKLFNESNQNHVYFRWIPTQMHTIALAPPLEDTDLTVMVAFADNQRDSRPLVITVEAGGVKRTKSPTYANKGDELNLYRFVLRNVPAGTSELKVTLHSPQGGDSGALLAATASYMCVEKPR